jgi:hypothetical protein
MGGRQEWGIALVFFTIVGLCTVGWNLRSTRQRISPIAPSATGPARGIQRLLQGQAIPFETATSADLEEVPGIGPVLARRLLALRESRGPICSFAPLEEVPGLGRKKLEVLRLYVQVGSGECP